MAAATDTGVFRYYNSGERVHARAMEDWLKCSVSLTEFRMNGLFPWLIDFFLIHTVPRVFFKGQI